MMQVLINHCWCSDSNWGGQYNCRVIVSIKSRAEGKTYYDAPTDDWKNLIVKQDNRKSLYDGKALKPEVVDWLTKNIKDIKLSQWMTKEKGYHPQGWAIGTPDYNSRDGLDLCVFFQRQTDALRFIRHWSSIKKPEYFFNYFSGKRLKYDVATKKLVKDV